MFILINLFFTIKVVVSLDPGNHKEQAEKLATILESEGYIVQYGSNVFFTPDMCEELDSCYCNNPDSPYGTILLPKAPGEDISNFSGGGKNLMVEVDGVNMSSTYRLDRNETIIMLGQTPPRCLYYSFLPYVFDRWYPYNWSSSSSDIMGKCPDVTDIDGERCEIFASFGDPINMINMNTSGEGGESFQSSFAHYMGGDVNQVSLIQKLSVEADIPMAIQNKYPISTSRVNLGLSATSDRILHWLRTAFTENDEDHNEYITNPSLFFTVLRVTPRWGAPGPSFPPNEFKPRISEPESTPDGLSYTNLSSILQEDLKDAVMDKYLKDFPFVEQFALSAQNYENGFDCMDQGIECKGDNQDTLYPNSREEIARSNAICTGALGNYCPIAKRSTLQEDGSDFYIATGINHNATKSALYSSIATYNYARMESIGSFTSMPHKLDTQSYIGSASPFLKDPISSPYFFAVKISRKCDEGDLFCLEVKESGNNSLPLANSLLFIERIYLDQMKAGPSKNATVKPIIYHFSSKMFDN